MKRPISRKAHGIADWTYIPLTALAPELLHFRKDKKPATLARVMAAAMLGSALVTRSEWGLFKYMPFKAHLGADIALGAVSLLAPWLGKFSDNKAARNTFLVVGISGIVIGGLLTQRKEM